MQRRWKAVRRGRASSSERGPVDMLAVLGRSEGQPLVPAQVNGPGAGAWNLSMSKGKSGLAIFLIAKRPWEERDSGQGWEHIMT